MTRTDAVEPGMRVMLQPLHRVRLTAGSLDTRPKLAANQEIVENTHILTVVFWPTIFMLVMYVFARSQAVTLLTDFFLNGAAGVTGNEPETVFK